MDELLPGASFEEQEEAKAAADIEKAKRRELDVADFRRVMSEAHGRRFVWRLLQEAKVFHDCSSENPLEMARFLGERRQGLMLMQEILRVCPEHWLNIIKEQKA